MEVVAYCKEVPSTPIHLANGRKIIFDSTDGITGFTLSADPGIIAQLDACERNGIGGVKRIPIEAYQEWVKKKSQSPPFKKPNREELTPANVNQVAVAHVAVDGNATAPKLVEAPKPAAPAEPQQPFKPKTVKRKT